MKLAKYIVFLFLSILAASVILWGCTKWHEEQSQAKLPELEAELPSPFIETPITPTEEAEESEAVEQEEVGKVEVEQEELVKVEEVETFKLGNADAPVLIEEFCNIQCPFCRSVSDQIEKFVRDNPHIARLAYYHLPFEYQQYAFPGAEAAECAGDQGKFWEYLAKEFDHYDSLNENIFFSLAKDLGLNEQVFEACLNNHEKRDKILSHINEGNSRQVSATPTFFINGQEIIASDINQLEPLIMEEYNKSL